MVAEQLAHNRAALNSLRQAHEAAVKEFLTANKALLIEMANEAINHMGLDRLQIVRFLERAVVTQTVRTLTT